MSLVVCNHSDSIIVEDSDEEIFLLYTALNAEQDKDSTRQDFTITTSNKKNTSSRPGRARATGLGVIDADSNELTLTLQLPTISATKTKTKKNSKGPPEIQVEIFQDVTGLGSRKGDTGSVIWRARYAKQVASYAVWLGFCILLAQLILTQYHHHNTYPSSTTEKDTIFDFSQFKQSRVLELGSGTGILPKLVGNLCAKWVATDQESSVPLLQKNLESAYNIHKDAQMSKSDNSKLDRNRRNPSSSSSIQSDICVSTIDWVESSKTYQTLSKSNNNNVNHEYMKCKHAVEPLLNHNEEKNQLASLVDPTDSNEVSNLILDRSATLIIAVDCLFNEQLVDPFLHTISLHAIHPQCQVLVVSELRSSLVMTSFLSSWLQLDVHDPYWNQKGYKGWEIIRLPASVLSPYLDNSKYACWCGRRRFDA